MKVSFKLIFSLVILTGWLLMVMAIPIIELQPYQVDLPNILVASDAHNVWGYDDLGRPLFDRLIVGAQTSLMIALGVIFFSFMIGTFIGTLSGYLGGGIDHILLRIIDVFMAFPGLLLAIALSGILGPGMNNVIIALSAVSWVGFARLSRAQVMSLKHREHVMSARSLGASHGRIIFLHILPLMMAPLLVEITFGVATIVIAEAGLSFLGLGLQPPKPSWGAMIR